MVVRNIPKELHQQRFTNRPIGSNILFGDRGNRFPYHGTKFEMRKYKKSRGGTRTQRGEFFPINQSGFMTIGEPSATIYANMMLQSSQKIADAIREGIRPEAPGIKEMKNLSVQTEPVETMEIRSILDEGDAPITFTRGTQDTIMQTTQGTQKDDVGEMERIRDAAFQAGLGRRKFHRDIAREIRTGLGMETRGQPQLTADLMQEYRRSFRGKDI